MTNRADDLILSKNSGDEAHIRATSTLCSELDLH